MEHKIMQFLNKGMKQDFSPSNASNEFAFENYNIRITCRDKNTLFTATNERGPKKCHTNNPIYGLFIGYCPIGDRVVVFTVNQNYSYIYLCKYIPGLDIDVLLLYYGQLDFNINNKINSLYFYENENIEKVYWIDGLNQPRFINIAASDEERSQWNDKSFDFVPYIKHDNFNSSVDVIPASNGMFKSGIVLYAFSYLNKFGSQTNIFDVTLLNYITNNNRGSSVDERVNTSFRINLNNLDNNFQYVRLYSIYRTSINSTPVTKVITDIKIGNRKSVSYVDSNNTGYDVEPQSLYFVGGEPIIPSVIEQKDNTLFMADYKLKRKIISLSIKDKSKLLNIQEYNDIIYNPSNTGFYSYSNQMYDSNLSFKIFLTGLKYRLGYIAIHNTGKNSDVVFINDYQIINYPTLVNDNIQVSKPSVNITDKSIIDELKLNGYVKILPVIVYPEFSDRNVICSGMLSPTIYNADDRFKKTVDIYSSWFARPNIANELDDSQYSGNGWFNEYKHGYPIKSNEKLGSEIQSIWRTYPNSATTIEYLKRPSLILRDYGNNFFVDQSVLTFHSPDILFDEAFKNIDMSKCHVRISGVIPIDSFMSDSSITTKTGVFGKNMLGYYKPNVENKVESDQLKQMNIMSSQPMWYDYVFSPKKGYEDTPFMFTIYPWHRLGSLINAFDINDDYESYLPAELEFNKMSNIRYSSHTKFAKYNNSAIYSNIGDIQVINSDLETLHRIKLNNDDLIYKPNVDKIISSYGEYPICCIKGDVLDSPEYLSRLRWTKLDEKYSDKLTGKEPVRIKYKSDIHSVISLNNINGSESIIPNIVFLDKYYNNAPLPMKGFHARLWDKDSLVKSNYCKLLCRVSDYRSVTLAENGDLIYSLDYREGLYTYSNGKWIKLTMLDNLNYYTEKDLYDKSSSNLCMSFISNQNKLIVDNRFTNLESLILDNFDNVKSYFFYAEIINPNVPNQFGGNSDEALLENTWLKCGDSISLYDELITLKYSVGDTFYQRYDVLKTQPYSIEDLNTVSDIVSFMCFSKINIDGRYDNNRGLKNNLVISSDKFNRLNDVYTLKDNFITCQYLNSKDFNIDNFKSDIIWSKMKSPGETIDSWTNISLINSLSLDGDKGKIQDIVKLNNEIYAFQEEGLAHILFNSRVLIPASDNVPIEISNSYKVDGKRYISNIVGTDNKDSICVGVNGVYFADNKTNSIYIFNGQLLLSLSDQLQMRIWIGNNLRHDNPIRTYYDKNNDDIYFVNNQTALCYSEYANTFTSFFSYEKANHMMNVGDDFLAIKDNEFWVMFEGEYNNFFDEIKPFSITYIANQDPLEDKIYNVLEYQADFYDANKNLLHNKTFTNFEIWNEYQRTSCLINDPSKRNNSIKRFRNWRLQIPRETNNRRDRIRNPWAFFKLSNSSRNGEYMLLSNILMHYSK